MHERDRRDITVGSHSHVTIGEDDDRIARRRRLHDTVDHDRRVVRIAGETFDCDVAGRHELYAGSVVLNLDGVKRSGGSTGHEQVRTANRQIGNGCDLPRRRDTHTT